MAHRISLLLLWLLMLRPASVAARDAPSHAGPVPSTYALLIGSNPGGEGQATLRYAEQDARRMAGVLTELGHFPASQTRMLLGPDKTAVLSALADLQQVFEAHRQRGQQAQLVFYYSGHARANALHLGEDELPLMELRERILALPTTLTLIVLDACQSGAFSQVKGATPAAAFSYNSVQRLQTHGVAVMASSTGSELSQESEALHGSYFTHHLLVALRGAADNDHDGVVSLAEAYGYAYERTLSATARTAVGTQHVTLETSLTGQGDVALTYPAEAGAQLELSAELEADVLVEREGAVLAELHKAKGKPLRLAFPEGKYTTVLRQENMLRACPLTLSNGQVTVLVPNACHTVSDDEARSKGYLPPVWDAQPPRETWGFELGIGLGGFTHDGYTKRLEDFGFSEGIFGQASPFRLQLAASRQVARHLSVVFDVRNYDAGYYQRELLSTGTKHVVEHFQWSSFAMGPHLRAHSDFFGNALRLYGQLGLGLGLAHSKLKSHEENFAGPVLSVSGGAFYMPWRHFGFVFQGTYAFAPVLRNELSDVHNSGNVALSLGVRVRTWSKP